MSVSPAATRRAMDQSLRTALRRVVETCRKLLEADYLQQAEARFGIHPDGTLEPLERLTHLDTTGQRQRRSIEQAIEHERAGGASAREAVERYIRESAFTMLNRLAALKLMEAPNRKLIPESVGRDIQSGGFKQFQLVTPLLANATTDGGYRLYLELLFDDLACELGALFDRHLPQAVLFPAQITLRAVLDELNKAEIASVWPEDETIGWIYQYFTPREQREQARRESSAPRSSYELAFRNQFYTPRYVVQFLVDNTLGRMWYEMRQGDTRLREECTYLVRRPDEVFLSEMTSPDSEHISEEVVSVAELLRDGNENALPPFDRSVDSIQRLIELAHCVDGYKRHPLSDELNGQQWAWSTKERIASAGTLADFPTQDILDVMFYTVRADRFSGGGSLEHDDVFIRLGNEVRGRALESHRSGLSQEESLRRVVFLPYRSRKDPRDLRILDPACGSGHFLLYCFDLLSIVYEEAWADEHGPESMATGRCLHDDFPDLDALRRAVPELILKHNLHGVDIDLRATQIATLALWLRAQRAYQELGLRSVDRPNIADSNIVCAEPMPGEREMLDEFLAAIRSTLKPAHLTDLVEGVWEELRLASEAGTLLKVEVGLREQIRRAHEANEAMLRMARQEEMFPEIAPPRQGRLVWDEETDEAFWERAERLVLAILRVYAQRAGGGLARRLFANDAERGFAFLDLLQKRFSVVLMNPPFGEASRPSKSYIERQYPRTKNDVYAAFVERGLELLEPRGMLGAITSRTGFFLSSFQKWREEILLKEARLTVMADLGYGVLDTAMVETAAYCLERAAIPSSGR